MSDLPPETITQWVTEATPTGQYKQRPLPTEWCCLNVGCHHELSAERVLALAAEVERLRGERDEAREDLHDQAKHAEDVAPLRLAQHLVSESLSDEDCEIATQGGHGRCLETAVAVRWEHGFADSVCEHHAAEAIKRGVVVVFGKRHDGEG